MYTDKQGDTGVMLHGWIKETGIVISLEAVSIGDSGCEHGGEYLLHILSTPTLRPLRKALPFPSVSHMEKTLPLF